MVIKNKLSNGSTSDFPSMSSQPNLSPTKFFVEHVAKDESLAPVTATAIEIHNFCRNTQSVKVLHVDTDEIGIVA